jgi:energy-coupling factor transporter ATP-binding protein EcfA2
MPLLEVTGLNLFLRSSGRSVQALRHLSFKLERGGALGLIGESGSGKSLTAMTLMGLQPQQASALHNSNVAWRRQMLCDVHHCRQRAVRRRCHRIRHLRRDLNKMRSRPQHDMRGIGPMQSACLVQPRVSILEDPFALLRQFPIGAGRANAATVRQTPGDAFPHPVFACRTGGDDLPHSLVPQYTGSTLGASARVCVQV